MSKSGKHFCIALTAIFLLTATNQTIAANRKTGVAGILSQAEDYKIHQQYHQALPLYRQAVKLAPQNSNAHAGLGWVLFSLGKQQAGLNETLKAVQLDPKNPAAHHHLGTIYWILNRPAEAANQFRIEFALDPKGNCHCGPMESLLSAYPPSDKTSKTNTHD